MGLTHIKMAVVGACLLFGYGCQKEGCTNARATNFLSEAEVDDGSCTFSGSAVFWTGLTTTRNWPDGGVSSNLFFYADDTFIDTIRPTNLHSDSEREVICGKESRINIERTWTVAGDQSVNVKVKGPNGDLYWEDDVIIEPNDCNKVKIILR